MKDNILLIDDEKDIMKYYIKALTTNGFHVKHVTTPDEAFDYLQENQETLKASIVDIMMPPGKVYQNQDTNEGLRTGALLFRDLHKKYPELPIVILTNVTNQETLSEFSAYDQVKVMQKLSVPPFELAETLKKMVGVNKNTQHRKHT